MGLTNIGASLETKIAHFRGELQDMEAEVRRIEALAATLPGLYDAIADRKALMASAEHVYCNVKPDAEPDKIKSVRARQWKSPFKAGEIGRTALHVLRDASEWMRTSDIARAMLVRIKEDPNDRTAREKLANTIGGYLKTHEGQTVESRGSYFKEWRVIRDSRNAGVRKDGR